MTKMSLETWLIPAKIF
jgi:uncharacterized protein